MKKILFAGESWVSHTTHIKGFDTFTTCTYGEGAEKLLEALAKAGYDVTYLNNEVAAEKFPRTSEELSQYDAVMLSDIGSNTLLLSAGTFTRSEFLSDRCEALCEYVSGGGSLCMIGGYMSFSGIDGKARYGQTALAIYRRQKRTPCRRHPRGRAKGSRHLSGRRGELAEVPRLQPHRRQERIYAHRHHSGRSFYRGGLLRQGPHGRILLRLLAALGLQRIHGVGILRQILGKSRKVALRII